MQMYNVKYNLRKENTVNTMR